MFLKKNYVRLSLFTLLTNKQIISNKQIDFQINSLNRFFNKQMILINK